jgi:hypothetical protein
MALLRAKMRLREKLEAFTQPQPVTQHWTAEAWDKAQSNIIDPDAEKRSGRNSAGW